MKDPVWPTWKTGTKVKCFGGNSEDGTMNVHVGVVMNNNVYPDAPQGPLTRVYFESVDNSALYHPCQLAEVVE